MTRGPFAGDQQELGCSELFETFAEIFVFRRKKNCVSLFENLQINQKPNPLLSVLLLSFKAKLISSKKANLETIVLKSTHSEYQY